MKTIGIIGAGAWGTALAQAIAAGGNDVTLWAREPEIVESVAAKRENALFMPDVILHDRINVTNDLSHTSAAGTLLLVPPAQYLRGTLAGMKNLITPGKPIVICAKGIELDTGLMMSQVAQQETPQAEIAVLTGPTFAAEIARGLPCAVTIAAQRPEVAAALRDRLASKFLRPYTSDDPTGVQIGGAVKNVIAIACGIVIGRGLGESARAALLTRGLAEMARLAAAMGAKKETLMGMCGVGDLVLTGTSMQSRNFSLGVMLGQGRPLADIMAERSGKAVTEGVHTAAALRTMAQKHGVEMPVATAVHRCIGEELAIEECIADLLDRPPRSESP